MSETTPKEQRGPTNLRIKFRSASLDQFIERYAADVSRGGIFIRTREPLAVGTQLRLELQLQDAAPLLSGEGTVIWIRENDPARPTVPPGMAVRFDKVSEQTQPTLERILAEKSRLETAAGGVPSQPSSGMAVRRPSQVLSALDAAGRVAAPASNAPTARVELEGTGERTGSADATGGGTAGPAATKTAFLGSRAAPAAPAAPVGPFTRARQTATRPVPVPSALFEPPTAADIDKALSVLEEAPGPAPMPAMPAVPRFVGEEGSNVPTRVADAAETAAAAAEGVSGPSLGDPPASAETGLPAAPGAPLPGAAPAVEKAAVAAAATPDMSRRFRAASKAYPTLNRRRGTFSVVALIVLLGAAGAVIWKLRPGSAVPAHPVTSSAVAIAPAAEPTAPPPAAAVPPPAPAAAPAEVAPPPAEKPPVAEKPAAPEKAPAPDKPASEERSASRHSSRHRGREEAASPRAAAKDTTPDAKPAETKPADAPATIEPPTAPDKPAADTKAEARSAAAVLKITSSPAGAEVSIDGSPVGSTPFTSKDVDPASPHAITLKKDGFETHERMVGASEWSRAHGSTPPSLKVNVKLRRVAPPPAAETPKDTSAPAEDTGGPYIKEVSPGNP